MAGKEKEPESVPGGPDGPSLEDPKEPKKPPGEIDTSTPSGAALAKVGEPPQGASDEDLNDHAAKYAAEKRKNRWV